MHLHLILALRSLARVSLLFVRQLYFLHGRSGALSPPPEIFPLHTQFGMATAFPTEIPATRVMLAWLKRQRCVDLDEDVQAAVEFIANHLPEQLSVELIADVACVGRRTLERRFRQQLGCSVGQAITALRIECGAWLLRNTSRPITLVEICVGIHDVGQFSRTFRRRFACSPSEYRVRIVPP